MRALKRLKLGTPSSGKESQGQYSTYLTPLQEHSKKPKENFFRGKPYWKNKQGNSHTNDLKKSPSYRSLPAIIRVKYKREDLLYYS